MNGFADIVHRREGDRLHLPGIAIELDLDDVTRPAIGAVGVTTIVGLVPCDIKGLFVLSGDDERSMFAEVLARGHRPKAAAHFLSTALQDAAENHACT